MAKLWIPQGEDQAPIVRNFDEYLVFDPEGRRRSSRRATGLWVMTRVNGVQQLRQYIRSETRSDTSGIRSAFFVLLGLWIGQIIRLFLQ